MRSFLIVVMVVFSTMKGFILTEGPNLVPDWVKYKETQPPKGCDQKSRCDPKTVT